MGQWCSWGFGVAVAVLLCSDIATSPAGDVLPYDTCCSAAYSAKQIVLLPLLPLLPLLLLLPLSVQPCHLCLCRCRSFCLVMALLWRVGTAGGCAAGQCHPHYTGKRCK